MVAIITGKGPGLETGSGSVLGSSGLLGSAVTGRRGESVVLNAATGNLVISAVDEMLVGRGPDAAISRTYNSLGAWDGDNNDQWRAGVYRRVHSISLGVSVKRTDWDGSDVTYTWDAGKSAYIATDGSGAYDTLTLSGSTWTWTDGDSQITETYDNNNSGRITARKDADGNTISYTYTGSLITRVTTGSGEYTDLSYTGTDLTSLVTYSAGTSPITRTFYEYDADHRLIKVLVNLNPADNDKGVGGNYVTTYTYDGASKRVATIAQDDGTFLSFTYTQVGSDYRVTGITQTVASGVTRSTAISYDTTNRVTTITDNAGQVTRLTYDSNHNLIKIVTPPVSIDATPQVSEFVYDAGGNVLSARFGPGNTIAYVYDTRGNRTLERDSAGNTVTRTFGLKNELLTETRYLKPDPDGAGAQTADEARTTTYLYDSLNHLRYVVTHEGRVSEYRYDGFGQRVSAIDYGQTYASTLSEAALNQWVAGTATRSNAHRTDTWYDFRGNVSRTASYATLDTFGRGPQGPLAITAGINTNVVAQPDGTYRITRIGGGSGWAADAHSSFKAEGDFILQMKPGQTDLAVTLGVSTAPGDGTGISGMNYSLFFQSGNYSYIEGGGQTSGGTNNGTDLFWITRTGNTIRYYKGASWAAALSAGPLRTVTDASTSAMYFDSAFNTNGAWADVSFTPQNIVNGANTSVVRQPDGLDRITKTGGADGVNDADARGLVGTSGDFVLQIRAVQADKRIVAGISTSPSSGTYPGSIEYGFRLNEDGKLWYNEGGGSSAILVGGNQVSYKAGDNLWLVRSGSNVRYYMGATLEAAVAAGALRTVAISSSTNYFDSSIYHSGTAIDVAFTPGSVSTPAGMSRADYVYDASGRLLSRIVAGGGVESFVYDGLGRVTASTDFAGATTSISFTDATSSTAAVTLANGLTQLSTYNRAGELVSYAEKNGVGTVLSETSYRYDSLGRLRSVTDPNGNIRYFLYDAIGRKVADIDGDGSLTEYRYDANNNLTSSTAYATRVTSAHLAALAAEPAPVAIVAGINTSVAQQLDGLYRVTKTGGTTGPDADGRSTVGMTGDFVLQIRPNQINQPFIAGVSTTPAASAGHAGIRGFYFDFTNYASWGDGVVWLGAQVAGSSAWLVRTGTTLNYYYGATLTAAMAKGVLASKTGVGETLYFDSSLYAVGSSLDVGFSTAPPSLDMVRPVADATNDRWAWNSYDRANRLIETIDGDGSVTEHRYDGASQLVSTTQRANRVSGTTLTAMKAAATSPNLWANPNDATLWLLSNLTAESAGVTIDGTPAFILRNNSTGGRARNPDPIPVRAGDIATLTYWVKAGTTTLDQTGLSAAIVGWGDNADSSAVILSGPGVITQQSGGLWNVSGLSTTEPTLISITRVFNSNDDTRASIGPAGSVVNGTIIVAKPRLTVTPARLVGLPDADATNDRVSRVFYSDDGQLIATLDAEGYLTEIIYDAMRRKIRSIGYANAAGSNGTLSGFADVAALRAGGTLAQLRSGLNANSAKDIRSQWLYDARGLVRATIGGEGTVTRFDYSPAGYVSQQLRGQKVDPAVNYTSTLPDVGTGEVIEATSWTYNPFGQVLTETRTLTGSTTTVTTYTYDTMRRLISTVTQTGGGINERKYAQRYDLQGRLVGELSAAGVVWLTANPTQTETAYRDYGWTYTYDAAHRLISKTGPKGVAVTGAKTLYYYNADDSLAYEVNALGEVVEYRYNAFGERTDAIVYGKRIASVMLTTMQEGAMSLLQVGAVAPSTFMAGIPDLEIDSRSQAEYTVDGAIGKATDALGHITTYGYNAFGELATRSNPLDNDGSSGTERLILSEFAYDRRGLLKQETVDEAGTNRVTTYGYDAFGRAFQLTNALGKLTASEYDRKGRLVSQTLQMGASPSTADIVTSYRYDARDNLIAVTDSLLNVTRYVYDSANRRIATIDALGGLVTTSYDADGRVVETRAYKNAIAAGTLSVLSEEVTASNTSFTTAVNSKSDDFDRIVRYAYDRNGQVRFTVDALGHVTEYVNDAAGNVIRTIAYDGQISPSTYTETSIATAVLALAGDVDNRISRAVYDGATGRLTYSIDAAGKVSWITYDAKGQITKQVQFATAYTSTGNPSVADLTSWRGTTPVTSAAADDRVTRAWYDAKGQLVASEDALGFVTRIEYDKLGNVKKQSVYSALPSTPPGDTTSFATLLTYLSGSTPQVTSFAYDTAGRLISTTDPAGSVTRIELDKLGQILSSTVAFGTTKASVTRYTYDNAGRVETQTLQIGGSPDTNADLTTHYTYDELGNVVKVRDARGYDCYAYFDKLGRQISARDAENYITDTSYTVFGEIQSVTRHSARATNSVSLGVLATWTWDSTDVPATTSFEYDRLGQLKKSISAEGENPGTGFQYYYEEYGYNTFGDRLTVRNRVGGVTQYTYDKRGMVLTVQAPFGALKRSKYDVFGNLEKLTEAEGVPEQRITEFEYDKANRLVETTGASVTVYADALTSGALTSSSALAVSHIKYDARGNVIQTIDASGTKTYAYYDLANRKIAEISPLGTLTRYEYDARGNVTSVRIYGTLIGLPLLPGGEAPTGSGSYRETFYDYDAADRLTSTSIANLATGEWVGHPTNAFVKVTSGTVTTQVQYDKAGNVLRQIDGRGYVVRSYYDKLGRKIAQVDQERFLTTWDRDAEGNVISETRYATKLGSGINIETATIAAMTTAGGTTDNRVTTFTYDRNGNRVTETRIGVLARTVSNSGELDTDATGLEDATISYKYNGLGQVVEKKEAASTGFTRDTINYLYDTSGRLTQETGAQFIDFEGNAVRPITAYSYDGLGNLKSTRFQKGTSANDNNDRITTYSYDAAGRLATMTVADNGSGTANAEESTRTYGYDVAGRTILETYVRAKSNGTTVEEGVYTRYDAAGRAIVQTNVRKNGSGAWVFTDATSGLAFDAVRMAYNAYGEVTGRGLSAGWDGVPIDYQETFEYDLAGRLWNSNTGDGVRRYYLYDKSGNQTLTIAPSVGTSALNFAAASNLMAELTTDGGVKTSFSIAAITSITVYDGRGQVTTTREPDRKMNTGATSTITRGRIYNAFGEVWKETDARDYTTTFTYNTMGRLIKKVSPAVSVTGENGGITTGFTPTEHYYYDLAGRLIGVQDANEKIGRRLLLAGTGHGGSEALVTKEFRPNSSAFVETRYDVFGDARMTITETGRITNNSYDKLGRLTARYHPIRAFGTVGNPTEGAVQLIDYYGYDALGQRTRHWNSQFGSGVVEKTDYDSQGRIVKTVNFADEETTVQYLWSAIAATSGLGTFGGWTKTTTNVLASVDAWEVQDYFGRVVDSEDFGNHNYDYTFDIAGKLVARGNSAGESIEYGYYNTGLIKLQTGTQGIAGYEYDAAGNLKAETFSKAGVSYRNATADYDALGRMTNWSDTGINGAAIASQTWEYDAVGNIRVFTTTARPTLDAQGAITSTPSKSYWYLYDSSNRMTLIKGTLAGSRGSGTITRGFEGTEITYYADGARASAATTGPVKGTYWVWHGPEGPMPEVPIGTEPPPGSWQLHTNNSFTGERREEYSYTADGYLAQTKRIDEHWDAGPMPTSWGGTPPAPVLGTLPAVTISTTDFDALGRITNYVENGDADALFTRFGFVYDNAGRVIIEKSATATRNEENVLITNVTHHENTYVGGLLYQQFQHTYRNNVDGDVPNSRQTYVYQWWDGAIQASISNDTNTDSNSDDPWTTTYSFGTSGHVTQAVIDDDRNRTVTYRTDQNGMIVERDEEDNRTNLTLDSHGDPRTLYYYFGGVRIGEVTNNGTENLSYIASIGERLKPTPSTPPSGPFRNSASGPTPYADFEQAYDAINGLTTANAGSSYTVRSGESLASIAQAVWGDASLWYLIADTNGLNASSPLSAGQTLTIPNKVRNNRNSYDTWRPYDPNQAMGDTSPTDAKPGSKNKCGMIGQILMVVVAVAVTALIAGPASAMLGNLLAGPTAAANAALLSVATGTAVSVGGTAAFVGAVAGGAIAGALGSAASQLFGMAIGAQQGGFNWKGVAQAGIAGGVSGGLGQFGFLRNAKGALGDLQNIGRGALNNAATQGIARLTGLQKEFDWMGIAVGGTVGGAAGAMHGIKMPLELRQVTSGTAGAIAGAVTRSALAGTSFGDNILAALPEVIASTVVDAASTAIRRSNVLRAAARSVLDLLGDGISTSGKLAPLAAPIPVPERVEGESQIVGLGLGFGDPEWELALSNLQRRPLAQTSNWPLASSRLDLNQYDVIDDTEIVVTGRPLRSRPAVDDNGGVRVAAAINNGHPSPTGMSLAIVAPGQRPLVINGQFPYERQRPLIDGNGRFPAQRPWLRPSETIKPRNIVRTYAAGSLPDRMNRTDIHGRNISYETHLEASRHVPAPGLYNTFVQPTVDLVVNLVEINSLTGRGSAYQQYLLPAASPFVKEGLAMATDPQVGMQMFVTGPGPVKPVGVLSYITAKGVQTGDGLWRSGKGFFNQWRAAESAAVNGGGATGRQVLYHYTNEAGAAGIAESGSLNPSLWRVGTKDVRYGNGQYVSDIVPGTRTPSQLSRDFLGQPFQGNRFTHYVEIDATGLGAIQGRPGVFVIPNEAPLNLTGKLLSNGKVPVK